MSAPLLPLFLKLEARHCLVVGGGAVALQKVSSLLECAARVTVLAPEACEAIRQLAADDRLVWQQSRYQGEPLAQYHLVIAASDDPQVNHRVYEDAVAAGVLANAVDDPPYCDFYFGSVVRRGSLQIGISTAGESPALAQRLRLQLESMLDDAIGPWLQRLGELRRDVLAARPPGKERNELLRTLASRDVCDAASCPSRAFALGAPPAERNSWWLT